MITQDQSEVLAFLGSSAAHGGVPVERIDTHASVVFLAGQRALKLKRAVRYDYLDFSTPELRRAMCEAEVRINRRTAPALYRGLVAITRERDGTLALGGDGAPVEWLVDMVRFDGDRLFDRLAARGALDVSLMPPLASAIAGFHRHAHRRFDRGGLAGMQWVVDGNATGLLEQGDGVLDTAAIHDLTMATRGIVSARGTLLESRREAGLVRQCHGDLHLRNIVLLNGRPTLFDAVEFNDEIACTDVLYDLAFLLMDLWRRQLPRHANAVWNGYLAETRDFGGVPLVPLFLSCRAAIRAKTTMSVANLEDDASRRDALIRQAREYLAMAQGMLAPAEPTLIAIGGFSGSGKSTIAMELGPAIGTPPGAIVIRSDEIRKQLCGVAPVVRLGPEGYAPEVSRRVYADVMARATRILSGGYSAIVDAVLARPEDRAAIERVAIDARVPFSGIWLDAPVAMLLSRAERRRADPSDADASVIRAQVAQDTGPLGWPRIDASRGIAAVARDATALLSVRRRAAAVA